MNENAIHIYFFLPSATSKFQLADMGKIACKKVQYKITMLSKLLVVFDDEHGIDIGNQYCKREGAGKGWHMDENQSFLMPLEILGGLWSQDG